MKCLQQSSTLIYPSARSCKISACRNLAVIHEIHAKTHRNTQKKHRHYTLKACCTVLLTNFHCSEEIRDELNGKPDGTFLVRDSRKKGNYTLAVRKDSTTHLVRINCTNSKYSFIDISVNPPSLVEFSSVPAFVEYFKEVSLMKFNSGLDVTLIHPHPRFVVRLRAN